VVVSVGSRVVADTREALTLFEATYPPVQYIPRDEIGTAVAEFVRTNGAT
jgi:uncharacterized protein (DUF427 family)